MNKLVKYIILNLLNSIILMIGIYNNILILIIISFSIKIGIFTFNNWIISISKRLNMISIYILSILIKLVYIIWFLNNLIIIYNLYYILFIIWSLVIITWFNLLKYDIKSIIMISSIILINLFWLINYLLNSYIYIVFYIFSNILLICSLIKPNVLLLNISILNIIGIPPLLNFFLKLNLFLNLFTTLNWFINILILMVYISNLYLYIRLLYFINISNLYKITKIDQSNILITLIIFFFTFI